MTPHCSWVTGAHSSQVIGQPILATGSLVTKVCLGLSFNAQLSMLSGLILPAQKCIRKKKINANLSAGMVFLTFVQFPETRLFSNNLHSEILN